MPELSDSESESSEIFDDCETDVFPQLVEDVVITGRQQGDTADNILMEIKSLKFSHNKDFADCILGIVPALLKLIVDESNKSSTGSAIVRIMNATKAMFVKGCWGFSVLKPCLQDADDEITLIE
jgi:hypothetical protein